MLEQSNHPVQIITNTVFNVYIIMGWKFVGPKRDVILRFREDKGGGDG